MVSSNLLLSSSGPYHLTPDILSDIYSNILSGILSDVFCGFLFGTWASILSDINVGILPDILRGILSDVLCVILSGTWAGILSGILSTYFLGILPDILCGILSGILCDILSGTWAGILLTEYRTFHLAFCLTSFLAFYLTFLAGPSPAIHYPRLRPKQLFRNHRNTIYMASGFEPPTCFKVAHLPRFSITTTYPNASGAPVHLNILLVSTAGWRGSLLSGTLA